MNVSDHAGIQSLLDKLGLDVPLFPPRYNIAPGAEILAVRQEGNRPQCVFMNWGIQPSWSRKPTLLFNSRAETIWEKPSFRKLVASQRAIVPANGFYEWKKGQGGKKIPYYIRPKTWPAFAIAAIYQISKDGVMEASIVTAEATGQMTEVHHRTPVILSSEAMKTWLGSSGRDEVDQLMRTTQEQELELITVSSYVNSGRNEGPECIKEVSGVQ